MSIKQISRRKILGLPAAESLLALVALTVPPTATTQTIQAQQAALAETTKPLIAALTVAYQELVEAGLIQAPEPQPADPLQISDEAWRVVVSALLSAHTNTLIWFGHRLRRVEWSLPGNDLYEDRTGKT